MEALLLLLLTASDVVSAMADPWALPTPHAMNHKGMLNARAPEPTPAPRIRGRTGGIAYNQLFARTESLSLDTCGYVDGDANSAYTCGAGTECATAGNYWQCCAVSSSAGAEVIDSGQCNSYVTCVNYQNTSSDPNSGTIPYEADSTIYCPSANPICFDAYWIAADSSTTYTSYGCFTETYTGSVLQNAISSAASATDSSNTPSSNPGSTPSSAAASTSSSSSSPRPQSTSSSSSSHQPQSTSGSLPASSAPGPTTPSSSPQGGTGTTSGAGTQPSSAGGSGTISPNPKPVAKQPGQSNVGAIAGGVVGGIAGIGLVGAVVGYLMYRKRQQRVEPMQEISPNYYAPTHHY